MSHSIADLFKLDNENLRDLFAVLAPRPSDTKISDEMRRDQLMNPHNDGYNKPVRRGQAEIECDLRYLFADEMMRARKRTPKELLNGPNSGRKPSPLY